MNILEVINRNINGFIWSPFMLAILLGTGVYFTIRTNFMQVFRFKAILKETIFKAFSKSPSKNDKKGITPFQALSTALAGTIGTGNIAGVATAITLAGPGSIFWMWVSAFFGMMTKYAEVVLAIEYRKKNSRGEWIGGPMIFIEEGLHMKWLALIYAALGVAASFGVGNIAQANSISTALNAAFGIPSFTTGIILSMLVAFAIAGGVKKIAAITEKIVPLMSILYIMAAIFVILINIENLAYAASLIFKGAFTPAAPIGGFAGAAVSTAIQKGISRGIFTNEAGLGSASIAHAAANCDHPAKQGLWGIFEVFFDTIVMCSITAFAILSSKIWSSGLNGSGLTVAAFDTAMHGLGKYTVAISLAFFAFLSILAWSYYGKKCMEYLAGERYTKYYLLFFVIAIVFGCVAETPIVWEISDALNGLMAVPNIIGLISLSEVVISLTRDGARKMKW